MKTNAEACRVWRPGFSAACLIIALAQGVALTASQTAPSTPAPPATVSTAEVEAFMQEIQRDTNGTTLWFKVVANPKRVPLTLAAVDREPIGPWAGLLKGFLLWDEGTVARQLPPAERSGVYVRAIEYLTAAKGTVSKALRADSGNPALQVNLQMLNEALVLACFESGTQTQEARALAQGLLDSTTATDPNHGELIYSMRSFLGRMALRAGDVATAKRHLLEAGQALEPLHLRWFNPQFELARDLLAKGEREAVLEHLDQMVRIWANPDRETNQSSKLRATEHRQSLDFWKEQIRKGRVPTGSNWPVASNAEKAASYRIGGRILDKSGAPLADATVAACAHGRELTLERETKSDSDGLFELPLSGGSALLLARKDGYAYMWKSWASFRTGPEVLVLTAPFSVAGVVVDEAGASVADAEVWVKAAVIEHKGRYSTPDYAMLNGTLARDCFSTRSGPDGRFRIGQLAAEAGVLLVASKGEKVSPGIHVLPTLNQMPCFAGQQDIKLSLGTSNAPASRPSRAKEIVRKGAATLTIAGLVRDGSGHVLEDVKLVTCPALNGPIYNPTAQTGADGRYTLTIGLDGLRSARKSNPSPRLIARDAARHLAAATELTENATNLDFTLEPGLEIAGRVEDPSGRALPNAQLRLSLYSSDHMAQSFLNDPFPVDAEGRFRINGLPPNQDYGLIATAADHGSESREVSSSRSVTNRVELKPFVLKVANRVLAGQLTDPEGQSVAGTFVHLYGEGQESTSARTDAEGRFRFEHICEGPVNLSASHKTLLAFAKAHAGETNVLLKLRSR